MNAEHTNRRQSITPRRLKEILLELAEVNLQCDDSKSLISVSGMEKVRSKLAS